jgi:hypothetical protein
MDYQELQSVLANLAETTATLENTYVENEGEVTPETEQMEATIADLKQLLTEDGIDLLGRWLKSKEDAKAALKAEKDYISRKIQSVDKSIAFIKEKIQEVMNASGIQKIAGSCGYSFTATNSTKTEVDKDILNDLFKEKVETVLRVNGIIPQDVTVTLGASVSKLPDNPDLILPIWYNQTITPTVTFRKPKSSKEA